MKTFHSMPVVFAATALSFSGCADSSRPQRPVVIERTVVVEQAAVSRPPVDADGQAMVTVTPTVPTASAANAASVASPALPQRSELGAVQNYGPAEANRDAYLNQPSTFSSFDFGPTYLPWPVTNTNSADRNPPSPARSDNQVNSPDRVRTVAPARP